MNKDYWKIIISRNFTFDEKLSTTTSTQVPWNINKDTEKDSSFSMSFLPHSLSLQYNMGYNNKQSLPLIFQLHIYHQILV
jgi:hypothetical protein